MAINLPSSSTSSSCDHQIDDDYIDMDITSTTFFCYTINSPPHSREFEFQMISNPLEREPITSPADELFYKGKLLPLHLPPRLQMVQKLLLDPNSNTHESNTESFEENYITTTNTTPFESCNISPSDSCHASRELNPDEYFYECSMNENIGFVGQPKKSWSKKFKLIKHSSLGLKLKASRAYLKSLFTKSGCSDESCADAPKNGDEFAVSRARECLNRYMKVAKRNPFGQILRERSNATRSIEKEKMIDDVDSQRRSFSGPVNRHSEIKSSSSSSSSSTSFSTSSILSANSNGLCGSQMLKRSSSANSEVESSIQGAIAHCKQSQQVVNARKSASEVGFCSLSASRLAARENQERPGLCRG